ncbi:MAG: hypothetical protein LBH86_02305, partial [Oscillospiraceae bacterium]|nr:hypothetical protein [Oscillospiraceae bacterium]
MDMSGKSKRIALVMALCMLVSMFQIAPATVGAMAVDEGGGRQIIDFNDGWQFYLATRTPSVASGSGATGFATSGMADAGGVTTAEVISPAYDDSEWRTVNVPHDFSIEGAKVSDGNNSQGYMEGGLGWYRKTFSLPEELRGKKISIDFEGVYQNSVVYVNGTLIG